MKLSDLLDSDLLAKHVDERNIGTQRHPSEPLTIYNYTHACQYRGAWDDVTRACRGLIVDDEGTVVARPFPKFHNLGEHHGDDPQAGKLTLTAPLVAFDKLDGSLGISYLRPSDGRMAWATRGSFVSDQAQWANDEWANVPTDAETSWADPGVTLLAEIVYPENKIVVDYDGYAGLILLAALDVGTGQHLLPLPGWSAEVDPWPGRVVELIGFGDDLTKFDPNDRPNTEGFVVLSGDLKTRVKLKADEYVRLHRIVTGVSSVTIWDLLRTGASLDDLTEHVPDEFYDWLTATVDSLRLLYASMMAMAEDEFSNAVDEVWPDGQPAELDRSERARFAEVAKTAEHPGLLFALLDGKPIAEKVWKLVKPERTTPFRVDADEPVAG